ncbi:caspase-7-like [Littorina saxatilis]|uniref:Caspase-3 n=1 Tax=Littorina saxatilis TaxID=31220 RepID=A0AAN9GLT0_9CAEN
MDDSHGDSAGCGGGKDSTFRGEEERGAEEEHQRQGETTDEDGDGGLFGEEEDILHDEADGINKTIKKKYKAVKRFFTRSGDQGKGDNQQPTSSLSQPPAPSHPALDLDEPDHATDDVYNFTHPARGRALIINNETFRPESYLPDRPGSSKDATALIEMFEELQFDVKCYHNQTAKKMMKILKKEADEYDHDNANCLAVAIMSHGDSEKLENFPCDQQTIPSGDKIQKDLIFGVDGCVILTESVTKAFQDEMCPGLVGKPRLFFLQACRGTAYDDGVDIAIVPDKARSSDEKKDNPSQELDDDDDQQEQDEPTVVSPAPIFKDFLVMYATPPGHFAWRRGSGTWFVQSLHTVFTKQLTPSMSLTQALTRVARMVAQGYESYDKKNLKISGKKQVPVLQSMLVKDVYFSKK